jgi:uncharacterized protein (DUF169 family)
VSGAFASGPERLGGTGHYPAIAHALRTVLLLASEPVGVRVIRDEAEYANCPVSTPSEPLHYCAAVRRATRGESLKLALTDISCDTSPRTLGLEGGFFDDDFIESYVTGGLYADRLRADLVLASVAVLPPRTSGILIRPLAEFSADEPPDVALMSMTPYAAMRLTQAAAFHGHRVRNEPIGMHGICAECTSQPILSGEISVSLLCSGTRHVADWEETELGVGVPSALLADVVDGLWDSVGRYECDDRKSQIRSCGAHGSPRDPARAAALEPGTGYFNRT